METALFTKILKFNLILYESVVIVLQHLFKGEDVETFKIATQIKNHDTSNLFTWSLH